MSTPPPRHLSPLIEALEGRRLLAGDLGDAPIQPGGGIDNPPEQQVVLNVGGDANGWDINEEAAPEGRIVKFSAYRTGDRTKELKVAIGAVKGTATVGEDFSAPPPSVTIKAGEAGADFYITVFDDAVTEQADLNAPNFESFTIELVERRDSVAWISPEPAQVLIRESARYFYSDWEEFRRPNETMPQHISDHNEPDGGWRNWELDGWVRMANRGKFRGAFASVSSDWGQPADITGDAFTVTNTVGVGTGKSYGVDLTEFGLPVQFERSVHREWTEGQEVTKTMTAGSVGGTEDTKYYIEGYIRTKYFVREYPTDQPGGPGTSVKTYVELGYNTPLLIAPNYVDKRMRVWRDPDAQGELLATEPPEPTPPDEPSVVLDGPAFAKPLSLMMAGPAASNNVTGSASRERSQPLPLFSRQPVSLFASQDEDEVEEHTFSKQA